MKVGRNFDDCLLIILLITSNYYTIQYLANGKLLVNSSHDSWYLCDSASALINFMC